MRFRILKFKPTGDRPQRSRGTVAGGDEDGRGRCDRGPRSRRTTRSGSRARRQHRLLIQRCKQCGTLRHPPRPMCSECRSLEWDTLEASRPRHRLQLRGEPLPAGAGVRLPARRRARRARRGHAARAERRRRRARATSRSACRSRSSGSTTTDELTCRSLPSRQAGEVRQLMDFTFSEEQDAVRDLATQIFDGHATAERVKEVERSEERVDRELWRELADAGLLAIARARGARRQRPRPRRALPAPRAAGPARGARAAVADPRARRAADRRVRSPEQQRSWLPGVARGEVVLTAALAESGANDPLHPQVTATP